MPILIPIVVVGLEAIIVWIVTFGARQSWSAFAAGISRLVHSPVSILRSIWNWTVIGQLTKAAEDTLSQGEDALGKTAQGAEPTTAGFVVGTGAAIDYHAFSMRYLADGVLDAFHSVKAYAIPAGVKAGTGTAREQSEAAAKRSRTAEREAARAGAAAAAAGAVAGRANSRAKVAQHDALAAAGAIAVPAPWDIPRVRNKELTDRITSWFSKYRKAIIAGLGAATLTGVVVRALTRTMPWFKCGNVNRTMRQLCRTPWHFLDDILALFADFVVLANICKVIPWLESGFELTAGPLIEKLAGPAAGLCGAGYDPGAALDVPALHLTPPESLTLHLV